MPSRRPLHSSYNSLWRRRLVLAAGLSPWTGAWAQAGASRTLRLVVPFPAGVPDMLARELAALLGPALGQHVVVENKPGASGQLATAEVLGRPADGQTLLLGHIGTHAINPAIYAKLNYRPSEDFAPLCLLANAPLVLVTTINQPFGNLKELQAYAKAHPGALNYGSPGVGSSGHLAGELIKQRLGIEMSHVPYKGGTQALQDLLGGQVQLSMDTLPGVLSQLQGGRVRVLAIGSAGRSPLLPEVATLEEQGLTGLQQLGPWFGLFARQGTAAAEQQRLASATLIALRQPELVERMRQRGLQLGAQGPADFTRFVQAEAQRWGQVARSIGLRPE